MKTIIFILSTLCFLGCLSENTKIDNKANYYLELRQPIQDSISKYLKQTNSNCDIFIDLDRSRIHHTIRLNVRIPDTENMYNNRGYISTKIRGQNAFLNSGIEDIANDYLMNKGEDWQKQQLCDGIFFVLYDSLGIIKVYNGINDFDDDLRPSKQLKLSLEAPSIDPIKKGD